MDPSVASKLVVIIILLCMSAFFSASETALTSVNRIRIRSLVEEANKRAIILSKVLTNSGKMLSAILIGNNIVNISISAIATVLATNLFGDVGAGYATGVLTLLILIFGEITPKTMATIHAESIALFVAPAIYAFICIMTPLIWFMTHISMGILFLLRVKPTLNSSSITESDLRTIVDVSHEEGVIEAEEREIINNLFDFGDVRAKDIMVPRIDMTMVEVSTSYKELLSLFEECRYTRIPVYESNTDNVIGIINMKDILLYQQTKDFCIRDYLRKVSFTYEAKKVPELLLEMRKTLINIVIVLDEYGSTVGLITLEDLLEEIVGEIRDEYDVDEEDEITVLEQGEYLVSGQVKLDDINELLHLKLNSEEYDSLGGYIIETLDKLPSEEDSILTDGYRFYVEAVTKNRIDKIHIYPLPASDPESDFA